MYPTLLFPVDPFILILLSCRPMQMRELMRFQHDPGCRVLLMDASGALGLDLSFVSHVFLLEPIWDPWYVKRNSSVCTNSFGIMVQGLGFRV